MALKYTNTLITFREIPDEILLSINLSNCPFRCKGCHSPQLQKDIGNNLTIDTLKELIDKSDGISCILFLGGDSSPKELSDVIYDIRTIHKYNKYKYAWYSGSDDIYNENIIGAFDYYKVGSYNEKYGSIDNINTNQRLYKVHHSSLIEWDDNSIAPSIITYDKNIILEDITYKFWNKQYK